MLLGLNDDDDDDGAVTAAEAAQTQNNPIYARLFCLKGFDYRVSHFPGFLIVAACVMTFEARDNAAKVVPATSGNNNEEERKPTASLKVLIIKWPL